jgi:undecaprenyl pyrophosphate phosphatase UppP
VKHVVLNPLPASSSGPFIVGTIASAAVGLVPFDMLLGYIRRHSYSPFVMYRLAVTVSSSW